MGRKDVKKEGRTKGNLQPSSSSRAAELLAGASNTAVFPSVALQGFGFGFGLNNATEEATSDVALNADLKLILRKLGKRDNVTVRKALEELTAHLESSEPADVVKFLPFWPRLYTKLSIDSDRRVREASNSTLLTIVKKVRKQLAPQLKELIGPWLVATFDASRECSKVASEAFQTAFPSRRIEVLRFCQKEILQFCHENIVEARPETLSDPRFISKEEMTDKYARVVAACFQVLATLLEAMTATDDGGKQVPFEETPEWTVILDEPKVFEKCSHEQSVVKRYCYHYIKVLCVHYPRDLLSARVDRLAKECVAKAWSERDATVYVDMFDAIVSIGKIFPEAWSLASQKKPVLRKIGLFYRSLARQIPNVTYPSLLPLLATIPIDMLVPQLPSPTENHEESSNSVFDLLDSILKVVNTSDRLPIVAAVQAYCECAVFMLSRLQKSIQEASHKENYAQYQELLVTDVLYKITNHYICDTLSAMGLKDEIRKSICLNVAQMGLSASIPVTFFQRFVSLLETTTMELLDQGSDSCPRAGMVICGIYENLVGRDNDEVLSGFLAMSKRVFSHALKVLDNYNALNGAVRLLEQVVPSFAPVLHQDKDISAALDTFVSVTIPRWLSETQTQRSSLVELAVTWIVCLDPMEMAQAWHKLLDTIFSMPSKLVLLQDVLKIMLKNKNVVKNATGLQHDGIDRTVSELVQTSFNNTAVEIMTPSLSLGILKPSTIQDVLARLLKEMPPMAAIMETQTTSDGHESANVTTELSTCIRILQAMLTCSSINPNDWSRSTLYELYRTVFDLVCYHETDSEDSQRDGIISVWESLLKLFFELPTASRELTVSKLSEYLANHVTQNVSRPIAFVSRQIRRLLLELSADPGHSSLILNKVLPPNWIEIVAQHTASRDEMLELSITDPFIRLWPTKLASSRTSNTVVEPSYDQYGMSLYARVTCLLLELMKDKDVRNIWKQLVLTQASWVWPVVELIRFMVIAQQARDVGRRLPWTIESLFEESHHEPHNSPSSDTYELRLENHRQAVRLLINTLAKDTDLKQCLSLCLDALEDRTRPSDTLCFVVRYILDEPSMTSEDKRLVLREFFRETIMTILSDKDDENKESESLHSQSTLLIQIRSLAHTHLQRILQGASEPTPHDLTDLFVIVNCLTIIAGPNGLIMFMGLLELLTKFLTESTSLNDSNVLVHSALVLLNMIIGSVENADLNELSDMLNPLAERLLLSCANDNDLSNVVIRATNIHWVDEVVRFCAYCVPCAYRGHKDLVRSMLSLASGILQSPTLHISARKVLTFHALQFFDVLVSEVSSLPDAVVTSLPALNTAYDASLRLLLNAKLSTNTVDYTFQETLANVIPHLPDKLLLSARLDDFISLLSKPNYHTQICAFYCLRRLIKQQTQVASLQIEMSASSVSTSTLPDDEDLTTKLPQPLIELVINDLALRSLDEFEHEFWWWFSSQDAKGIHERTMMDDYSRNNLTNVLTYLLAWASIIDHFDDATFKLKTALTLHLRALDILPRLLRFIFTTLNLSNQERTFDLSRWDIDSYSVLGFTFNSRVSLKLLCCWIYLRCLQCIPSLVRNWFLESRDRSLTLAVESFTETYLSPLLLNNEFSRVTSLKLEDIQLKLLKSTLELLVAYVIEESSLDMIIKLPRSYPLRGVEVSCTAALPGVKEQTWRSWLLSSQAVLTVQNGSLVDAVTVFQKNVKGHFEGVEECAICYSIIGTDRTVPNKACRTCKHKFHGGCLFKWFKSSAQSNCPLCRSLF